MLVVNRIQYCCHFVSGKADNAQSTVTVFTARNKVMFLHLSMILFTGGSSVQGRGCTCSGGSLFRGGLCPGRHPPYDYVWAVRILLGCILGIYADSPGTMLV